MSRSIKKIFLTIILFILLIMSFALFLVSCSAKNNSSQYSGDDLGYRINLNIVYSQRQNSSAVPSEDSIGPFVMSALDTDSGDSYESRKIKLISSDGKPKMKIIDAIASKKNVAENRKAENKETLSKVVEDLKNNKAQTEESDIFDAICLANDSFDNNNDLPNIVVVVDSGISTKGLWNMQNTNLLNSSAKDITSSKKIPNLKNIDQVVWLGFNQVSDPQDRIPPNSKDNIQNLYNDVLKEAHVDSAKKRWKNYDDENRPECIEWKSSGIDDDINPGSLPKVTTIKFPDDDNAKEINQFEKDTNATLVFHENQIKFMPDKATFVDENSANEVLSNVAEVLKKNTNINVVINGYISSDVPETGTLSQQRADTVKNQLIALGVNGNQMTSIGKGQGPYPFMVDGVRNANNRFIEIKRVN